MSASQVTPKANPVQLPAEKSLPPPPPCTDHSDNQPGPSSSAFPHYASNTIKALPARPALARSFTDHASSESKPLIQHSVAPLATRSKSAGNTASFLDLDSESPEAQVFPSNAAHTRSSDVLQAEPARHAPSHPEASPQQPFYSPCLSMSQSPNRRSAQLAGTISATLTSSDRRAPRPSLPAQWKSRAPFETNAPFVPPRFAGADPAALPEGVGFSTPNSFHDHSGQSSPASQRLSSHHTYFSSDYSLRNSASTHTSIWTEPSLASGNNSPASRQYMLKSDASPESLHLRSHDAAESTEELELDESKVGLGITSDVEHDTSSRRSSAALVSPSPVLPASVKAFQGPFSHHRAPSWTRRLDLAPSSGMPSSQLDQILNMQAIGGARELGLSVGPHMQRALSDVTPVSGLSAQSGDAIASAPSSSLLGPSIPLRRDSRVRCSSDSVNYHHSTPPRASRHSPSLSVSSCASVSGRFTPVLTPASSGFLGGADLSALQSPPRSSSLRHSPSVSSLRGSPSLVRERSQRTPPALAPIVMGRSSSRAAFDRVSASDEARMLSAADAQQTLDLASGRNSPSSSLKEPSLRTTSAASRTRRASDVSINSFLQNAEFSHIVGAYASRMRWEEGLYDFDESAETEGDESRAVKTAEEGSATIVQGRHLTLAQIDAETGPNTTHLLLGGNDAEGLTEVLERVLPLTTNLLVLDLSNCNLERLPDAIGACIALEELDISGNAVEHLPDWILNLRALRTLSADRVGLHHLPSSLIQLQELQRLSLRNNELVFLPSWLHRMSKLSNLFVEGNRFGGPWQDIVAPLLGGGAARNDSAGEAVPQHPHASGNGGWSRHVRQRSSTQSPLGAVPERPLMSRLRSANDLQTMLSSQRGGQDSPNSNPDISSNDSGYVSPVEGFSRLATTGREDQYRRQSISEEVDPSVAAQTPGKWGGFLKKIGRKASSHRLGSANQEAATTSPSESRFSSPKAMRKSLRSSGSVARLNSASRSSAAQQMTASQSEPLSPTIALSSLSLAAAVADDHAVGHAPMTPLEVEAPSKPSSPASPPSSALLQPISLDAEAKKARRRSFLPVHAFASAAGGLPPHLAPASVAAAAGTAQEEMDEESLSKHRNRLRALMHYLRDLDDLTAVRTEAASFVGPSKSTLSHLRDGEPLSRTASMHRAESSNPSTKSRDSGGEYVASTAASSISEGASSEPTRLSTARCSKDDSVRRFRIIAEIVSTERTYVRGLSELVDVYVRPAMAPADGNSGVPVIPPMEHRAVFGNVEALLQFHRTVFLPSLLAVTNPILAHDQEAAGDLSPDETAAIAEKVAAVFSTHAAFFKMYTSYINNCDSAQARISAWMAPSSAGNGGGLSLRGAPGYSALQAFGALSAQQGAAAAMFANGTGSGQASGASAGSSILGSDSALTPSQRKKIRTFMKRCRTHPRHTQINVESYLLLPVQRIPRYRLLLEDLVKSTDTARLADGDALATALEHVTQIASKVNESKRQSEQDRRLLAWQYRIRGPIEGPLVQPHRRLLKDGTLQLKRTVRRIPGFVRSSRSASVSGARPADGGPVSTRGSEQVLSADHLQQTTEDQSMALILCSDVAVLCVDQSQGRDVQAPVLLRSVLKLTRPVEILGGVNLRLVDRSEILYLAAGSPDQAVAWKTAFDLHFYQ